MPVIETHELTKRYGLRRAKSVLAVDQVSFAGGRAPANRAAEGGEATGVLGDVGGVRRLQHRLHRRECPQCSPVRLGVLFLYIIVEEGIIGLMQRGGEALKRLTEYLPFNLVQDLGDDLAHYPEVLARVNADRAERGVAPLEYLDVDVMAIAVLTYSAIFLLIAFLSMRKRDL